MTLSARVKAANALGLAGQWIQFVIAAWLAFTGGGYLWSSAYLLAVAAPSVLPLKKVRILGLSGPAGLIILAASSNPSLLLLAASGAAVGVGAAASGRPLAWSSGLTGGPGWGGPLGAGACVFLPSLVGTRGTLLVAAGLLTLAVSVGESHDRRGSLSPILLPAAMALAVVAGLRVLEPGFGGGLVRAPAVFGAAWAVGTHLGWRSAPGADPRAILAAPFAAAMAMAGLGVVRGPGLVFLYGFLGACCGLVGGGRHGSDGQELATSRRFLLVGLGAGALWANAPFDYQTLIWSSAGVVLAGGFVTSILSRRVPVPEEVLESPEEEPLVAETAFDLFSADVVEDQEDSIRQAIQLLLDATAEANAIRGAALAELRLAGLGPHKAIENLLVELRAIRSRVMSEAVSEG